MPYKKYPVLALSLRPKDGISDEDIGQFIDLTKRYAEQACIITHKSDSDRHIHAVWFLKEPRQVSDISGIKKPLGNLFHQKWVELSGSIWKVAVDVKNCYNDDWFSKYLEEEKFGDAPRVIHMNTVTWTKQQRLAKYMDSETKPGQHIPNPEMHKYRRMFKEDYPDNNDPSHEDIIEFFTQHYFIKQDLKMIKDPRKFKSEVRMFYKFLRKESGYPWHNGTTWEEYF